MLAIRSLGTLTILRTVMESQDVEAAPKPLAATDLASKEAVAVYPIAGWWKNHRLYDQSDKGVDYSLVVSIESPEVEVDLWTPVAQQIATVIEV